MAGVSTTPHRRDLVTIVTSAGNGLLPLSTPVIRVTKEGNQEVFASELRPADRTLAHKDYSPATLEEVVGLLMQKAPGYASAREYIFASCQGFEVPKLRRDLLEAIAANHPEVFTPEEYEGLTRSIHRVQGADFSDITIGKAAKLIQRMLGSNGVSHSYQTYVNWLNGDVLHPENTEEAFRIAGILGSPELEERSLDIHTAANRQSPYHKVVDMHRTTMSLISAPKSEGTGERSSRTAGRSRVHGDLPEWRAAIMPELEARKRNSVVEAVVYRVELADGNETCIPSADTGYSRGIVSIAKDPVERTAAYQKLSIEVPPTAGQRIMKGLEDAIAADAALRLKMLTMILGSSEGLFQDQNAYRFLFSVSLNDKTVPYTREAAVGPLRPMFGYSLQVWHQASLQTPRVLREASASKDARRSLVAQFYETWPKDSQIYRGLSEVYDSSLVLKRMMSMAKYIKSVSTEDREIITQQLKGLALMNDLEKQEHIRLYESAVETVRQVLSSVFDSCSAEVAALMNADRQLPVEIAQLRSLMPNKLFGRAPASDELLMGSILQQYGITYGQFSAAKVASELTLMDESARQYHAINSRRELEGLPTIRIL